jgi:hypothetical protein
VTRKTTYLITNSETHFPAFAGSNSQFFTFALLMKPGLHTMKHIDSLVYLDDYIDSKGSVIYSCQLFPDIQLTPFLALEALPLELQRNFTLMRELDGYAQGRLHLHA